MPYPLTSWALPVSFEGGVCDRPRRRLLCAEGMGLSLLEKSILIAEERSNGVVLCNGGGMEPFTGGSGVAAEGSPSGWESMGCHGCRGAGTRELCTCRKINHNVIVVLQEYTSVEFVGSLGAISTSAGCDAFQSEFTNEGIMVEI
jgi:hypothetical protein